jgi:hypothetical protein
MENRTDILDLSKKRHREKCKVWWFIISNFEKQ